MVILSWSLQDTSCSFQTWHLCRREPLGADGKQRSSLFVPGWSSPFAQHCDGQ